MAWLGFRPPPMKALFDASSFMLPQWMYVAARLRLAERFASRPMTSRELADGLDINADRLGRLLYALEQRGYFQRIPHSAKTSFDGPWENTALSATLMEAHPNSIRPILLHWMEDCYRPGARLLDSLRSGECAFKLEHAPDYETFFGDLLPKNKRRADQFSHAMSATSAFTDQAVLKDFRWDRFKRLVDIGGSNGSFLDLTLGHHPTLKGLIFDLPGVIESARTLWSERRDDVSRRMDYAAGSFFDPSTIPPIGHDEAYVLRNILHDWSNEDCVRILENLRRGMSEDTGCLILVELGLGFDASGHVLEQARSTIDLLMLTMFEGRERRTQDFQNLFERTGFELVSITPTRSVAHIIQARPK